MAAKTKQTLQQLAAARRAAVAKVPETVNARGTANDITISRKHNALSVSVAEGVVPWMEEVAYTSVSHGKKRNGQVVPRYHRVEVIDHPDGIVITQIPGRKTVKQVATYTNGEGKVCPLYEYSKLTKQGRRMKTVCYLKGPDFEAKAATVVENDNDEKIVLISK